MHVNTQETEHYDIETGERLSLNQLDNYKHIKSVKNVKKIRETTFICWHKYYKPTKNEPTKQGKLWGNS